VSSAQIRDAAFISVGRGCMFAALAIWAAAFGFISWPLTAFRLAALLTTLTGVILVYKAVTAHTRPYQRTEVWAMIGKPRHVPKERAQAEISSILRETFWRFAHYAAGLALALWFAVLATWLLAPGATLRAL
jgi:hypothetical protein